MARNVRDPRTGAAPDRPRRDRPLSAGQVLIVGAIALLDRGKGIPHQRVKEWVSSWETRNERHSPKAV